MVRPAGIEPATLGLEVRCSVQLSYGRTANIGTDDSIALADRGRRQEGRGLAGRGSGAAIAAAQRLIDRHTRPRGSGPRSVVGHTAGLTCVGRADARQ